MSPPVRSLFLTYPQCAAPKEFVLEHLKTIDKVLEYVVCIEKHEDGNPHLHAYVKFEKGLSPPNYTPTLDLPDPYAKHGNYQAVRSFRKSVTYCQKDGDYITNLDEAQLLSPQAKRAKFAQDLQVRSVSEMVLDGTINFQAARAASYAKSIMTTAYEHDTVRGVWIYGPSGSGKSHMARQNYGPVYVKPQNKWWDGYNGEKTVLLDDYDAGSMLGHHLKIWSDKYACTGEIKSGTINLAHEKFIVTSNYSILECFGTDGEENELVRALHRRFEIIYKETQ